MTDDEVRELQVEYLKELIRRMIIVCCNECQGRIDGILEQEESKLTEHIDKNAN